MRATLWDVQIRSYTVPGRDCWMWAGYIDHAGYGRAVVNGKQTSAHRAAWMIANQADPGELEIDHLCQRTACVNPAHLEAVSKAENLRRKFAAITHCVWGHEYNVENTYLKPSGHRDCRPCMRRRTAECKMRKQWKEKVSA